MKIKLFPYLSLTIGGETICKGGVRTPPACHSNQTLNYDILICLSEKTNPMSGCCRMGQRRRADVGVSLFFSHWWRVQRSCLWAMTKTNRSAKEVTSTARSNNTGGESAHGLATDTEARERAGAFHSARFCRHSRPRRARRAAGCRSRELRRLQVYGHRCAAGEHKPHWHLSEKCRTGIRYFINTQFLN